MLSNMFRNRSLFRNGCLTDAILLGVFLTLAYIFMVRRGYMSQVDSMLRNSPDRDARSLQDVSVFDIDAPKLVPEKSEARTRDEKAQEQINMVVSRIQDVRSESCKTRDYSAQVPVSIIVHFFDYSFHDMKFTISSVLQFTSDSLIRDIIIVDDGSTLDYIIKEAVTYVDHIPKAMLLRNEQQEGAASARMRGAQKAMGANLVFLDPSVIVSPGWLGPLADKIQREPRLIAVPHLDKINDPVTYEYVKVDSGLIPGFTWNLDITVTNRFDYDPNMESFSTTVIRGNVFAITKIYLDELKGLDTSLSEGGGDSLELSFRTWMCGGEIQILPCSHVAVLGVRDPVKIVNSKNIWRIAELWLGNGKDFVYSKLSKNPESSVTNEDRRSLEGRRTELKSLTCKDFAWFLSNVAVDAYIPSPDVEQHGIVQIKNGRCMRVSREDFRIDLGSCTPEHNKYLPSEMIVEYTRDGLLRSLGKCLAVQSSAYVVAETCNKNNDHQQWRFDDKQRFVNKWSGYCLIHVTDPDPKLKDQKRQIAMAQGCNTDSTKDKYDFSSWKFLSS